MVRLLMRLSLITMLAGMLAACASAAPAISAASNQNQAAAPAAAATAVSTTAANIPVSSAQGDRTFQIVPDQSQASYEVTEKFMNRDLPNQAIGKTNAIQGTLVLNTTGKPTASIPKMTVDLSTLTSDEARRDNMIKRNWLQSSQYPLATFVSTGISGAPDAYTEGQDVSFQLAGNLTIHNTTKPVTWDVKAKLAGDTLTGTATTKLLMKDFGFDPPNIANMLTVTDGVAVTVNFTAKAAK